MEHIAIEAGDHAIFGELKPGTRTYTREGTLEQVADWFDRISLRVGPTVSLGGVMMYCPVSRSALHERIERGGLTVFEFNVTERKANLLGSVKTVFRKTYAYVPVSELRSWRKDIEERAVAKGIKLEPGSTRVDEIVFLQNREDDENKKNKSAVLEVPLNQYDLEAIHNVAWKLKYASPGHFIADALRPIIDGGFSGVSFGRAGLWIARLIDKHGIGTLPMPKFITNFKNKMK